MRKHTRAAAACEAVPRRQQPAKTAEHFFAAMLPSASAAEPGACAAAIIEAFQSGHISRGAFASLHAKMRSGVAPAVLRPMLVMAECGLPSAVITASGATVAHSVPVLHSLPGAREFFEQYVLPSKPVIFRGTADASSWPPMRNLADAAFLRERCGHRGVECVAG